MDSETNFGTPVAGPRKISPVPPAPSNLSFLFSVALISAAVLGFEVALTRVFAVLLRYQFAFLVVSLALCGLGLGGLVAHRRRISLPNAALAFGFSVALSLYLILRVVFAHRPDQFWIAALLVLVPFTAAGVFLSAAFSHGVSQMGRLYGWDLAGAAVAAAASVFIMQLMGALDACLVFAALGGLAAVCLQDKPRPGILIPAVLLFLFLPLNRATNLWDVPKIPPMYQTEGEGENEFQTNIADRGVTQPLYAELGDPKLGSKIVDTRWNAFARTDVVVDPQSKGSFLLYTNGNVPTNMMKWDGNPWTLPRVVADFPLSDWTFKSANLKDANVLAIGPGGGLDALLALRYGAARFDGAEINPSIVQLMNEPRYKLWNGGIYSHPKVHVQTAEGRAFVREQVAAGKRYRLLFSALTKTATAGQGMALLESYIYTQDAFRDYLSALDDDGQMAIVGDAPVLLSRLFVTAMSELKTQGLTDAQAGQRIAITYFDQPGPYQWSLVVKKRPFTPAETEAMYKSALERRIYPVWVPGHEPANPQSLPNVYAPVASGSLSLNALIRMYAQRGLDMTPCPDNRPFVLDLGLSPFTAFTGSPSLSILLGLSLGGTAIFAALTMVVGGKKRTSPKWVLYFLALGIGFMLVEIPLIQKLVLPLGYPTLSLTVILFALLLGGGCGALFSQRFSDDKLRRHAQMCALGVVLLSVVFVAVAGPLGEMLLRMPLVLRCALTTVMLLPLGFLLGTPFPSGVRLLTAGDEETENNAVPLIWALNGTASVVGSMAAAVGAKAGGVTAVMAAGALIYLLAAGLLVGKSK